jgi:carboxylesterase
VPLAERFFEQGWNVYLPRTLYHGYSDRLSDDHARLNVENMVRFTNEVVDILRGLGEKTALCGLSGGGVMTSWAAMDRSDLDLAVIIAPDIGVKVVPPPLTRTAIRALLRIPNRFSWWDPRVKEKMAGAQYSYPRFSSHVIAHQLRIGAWALRESKTTQPATKKLVFMTNDNDYAVNNEMIAKFANQLRADPQTEVRIHVFTADQHLPHDLIDVNHPEANVEAVYPVLEELIEEMLPAAA